MKKHDIARKMKPKLSQVSKEYFGGKWQKVGFYENDKGKIVKVKPIK